MISACTPRGVITFLPEPGIETDVERIHYATVRQPASAFFSGFRSEMTTYGHVDVSIPPSHVLGQIEWPGKKNANPSEHFVTTDAARFGSAAAFRSQINETLARDQSGNREVTIFVHGFNNTFAESVYRFAQLSHDLEFSSVPVLFAWPSSENPLGYAYGRDSALVARDGLQELIEEIFKTNAKGVVLVTHSMGGFVAMETLRQMNLSGSSLKRKPLAVALIAPDIDVDVFRAQAHSIGKLPQPFFVLGSRRDRALQLSGRLTGSGRRIGSLESVDDLSEFEITFIDTTGIEDAGSEHFAAATSPALLRILGRVNDYNLALSRDQSGRTGLLPGTVLTVQNATRIILTPLAQ